jgi:hypothetical protein
MDSLETQVMQEMHPDAASQIDLKEDHSWWVINDLFSNLNLDSEGCKAEDEDLAEFEWRLRKNTNYFLSWTGGGPGGSVGAARMSEETYDRMITDLFKLTKRPRTKKAMDSYEFLMSKSLDVALGFFLEAFAAAGVMKKRLLKQAKRVNDLGKSFAGDLVGKGMNPEYLPGLLYLHRWNELYMMTLKRKIPPSDPSAYDGELEYAKLSDKSKGIVLAAKCFFRVALRKSDRGAVNECEAVQAMKEV